MHTDQSKPGSRWLLILLVLLGVGMMTWVFLFLLPAYSARQDWLKYARTLHAAGEPLTLAEIEALRPAVPDEQNASLILENLSAAFDALKGAKHPGVLFFDKKLTETDALEPLSDEILAASREFLSTHIGLLDKLAPLRECTGGRLSVDFAAEIRNPIDVLLPPLMAWRPAAKLCRLDAALALEHGDAERALSSLELQFRIAGSLDSEPLVMPRLVQTHVDSGAVDTVERILAGATVSTAILTRIESMLGDRFPSVDLSPAFRHERVCFVDMCNGLASGRIKPGELGLTLFPRFQQGAIRDGQIQGAKLYARIIAASGDAESLVRVTRLIDSELTALAAKLGGSGLHLPVVLKLFPSFSRAAELHAQCGVRGAAALCGLAAEKFRLAEGRFPDSIVQLVPQYLGEVPADPFDGQPMRFRRTDYGIVIYSIGEDMADDGGDLTKEVKKRTSPDVGFRVLLPALRGSSGVSPNTDAE